MLTEEDEEFMSNMVDEPGKDSGCTAVVALLRDNELYVANAGESLIVQVRRDFLFNNYLRTYMS